MIKQEHGSAFNVSASAGTSVTLTQAASTNVIYFVTDIAVSAPTMGTWTLVSNGVTLWQGTGTYNGQLVSPIAGSKGNSVIFSGTGTGTVYGNISGFSITAQ